MTCPHFDSSHPFPPILLITRHFSSVFRLVLPAMLFLSKKIDMTDPKIIFYAQVGLLSVGTIMLLIHGYCYMMMSTNKDKRDIWVPPKAKPTLPFGLGPPAEPVKAEEFEKTTYKEYETKLLKESAFGILMSLAISMGMSLKFNVHVSLLMQSVMMPMGLLDSLVIKKYILGSKTPLAYGELFAQPTEATLAAAAGTSLILKTHSFPY